MKLFDHYSFRARLQPALLTLLPAAIAIFAWAGPGVKWQSALWALFGTVGGTFFLGILARNLGKQMEPKLWQHWGGCPTTQLLRHSGPGNPVLRERWHKCLSKFLNQPMPTVEEESLDPVSSDQIYRAGTKLLIGKTRDVKKFHLVYSENVQYGYCRNLYAMRAMGVFFSAGGAAASLAAALWNWHVAQPKMYSWVCLLVDLMFLIWWLTTINAAWVRVPAFAYAERLLESAENLTSARKPRAEKEKPGATR